MDVSLNRCGEMPGMLALCIADSTALPVPGVASHTSTKRLFCLTVMEAMLLRGTTAPSFMVTLMPSSRACLVSFFAHLVPAQQLGLHFLQI